MLELQYDITNFLVFPIDSRKIAVAEKLQKSINNCLKLYFDEIHANYSSTNLIVCTEMKLVGFFSKQLKKIEIANEKDPAKLANESVKFTFATYIVLSLFELFVRQNKINQASFVKIVDILCYIHNFLCQDIILNNSIELLNKIAEVIQKTISPPAKKAQENIASSVEDTKNVEMAQMDLKEYLKCLQSKDSKLLLNKITVTSDPNRHGNEYSPYAPLINNMNNIIGCLAIQQYKDKLGAILDDKLRAQCCMLPLIRRPIVSKENFIKYTPNETSSLNPNHGSIN